MKSIAHAWVGLMAIQRLKKLSKSFKKEDDAGNPLEHRDQAKAFIKYFDKQRDAFVQGAWFPDSVIQDNLTGGHTYKLAKPKDNKTRSIAEKILNKTPSHLSMKKLVPDSRFQEKVYLKHDYSLPDRCEALSHAIRDMMLIHKKVSKGSDILFNDDQITLYFLMLAHYLADSHVPPHSDARDFYGPSKIHPDMESYWDDEIKKYYQFDKKRKVFNYDIEGAPELKPEVKEQFKNSFLSDAIEQLNKNSRKWDPSNKNILGKGNKKPYDYLKAVCHMSYLVSTEFIPEMSQTKYDNLDIVNDSQYSAKLRKISINVLADAIDSIALIWLLTWEKLYKLDTQVKKRTQEIKAKGGKVIKS